MCSNIPTKPTYSVYVSQLIRICRICDTYLSFVTRHRLLTERLIKQGFWYTKVYQSFKKFTKRHYALLPSGLAGTMVSLNVSMYVCTSVTLLVPTGPRATGKRKGGSIMVMKVRRSFSTGL